MFEFTLLAALWGGSFFFLRASVAEFGAIVMILIRVALAGLFLLPFVFWKKKHTTMVNKIVPIMIVGFFNSVLGFTLFAYSTIFVPAGFASILNAVTPMFAVAISFLWLKQKTSSIAIIGLLIGVSGVTLLVWDKIDFSEGGAGFAILAGLAGAASYGIAATFSKKYLNNVEPMAIASGSLLSAAVILLPFAINYWPSEMPSARAWVHVLVLSIACTGYAQILYFRLISSIGSTNTTSVTFVIPVFGLLWGSLFLDEIIEFNTIVACLIILIGTGLTLGLIKMPAFKKV